MFVSVFVKTSPDVANGARTGTPHGQHSDLVSLFSSVVTEVGKNYLIRKQCSYWDSLIVLFNSYELQMLFITSVDLVEITMSFVIKMVSFYVLVRVYGLFNDAFNCSSCVLSTGGIHGH
jgi:hypothetical protein